MTHHVFVLIAVPPPTNEESDDDLLSEDKGSLSSLSDVEEEFACETCGRRCSNAHYLRQHIAYGRCGNKGNTTSGRLHQSRTASFSCPSCRKTFKTQFLLDTHLSTHVHQHDTFENERVTLRLEKVSLERLVRDYKMTSQNKIYDIGPFLMDNIDLIHQMFDSINNFLVKALLYLRVQYIKINQSNGQVLDVVEIVFPSKAADYVVDIEDCKDV